MEKQGIYAYGVVSTPSSKLKIDEVLLISFKDLAIVAKSVSVKDFQKKIKKALESPEQMKEVLLNHQQVLEQLMKKTTVVPFQFGTILKSKKGAEGMLKSSYVKFKRLLGKLKDKQEWGLRLFIDKQSLISRELEIRKKFKKRLTKKGKSLAKSEKSVRQGAGTAYLLGQKMAQEAEEKTEERLALLSDQVYKQLGKVAFEAKITSSAQRFSEKGEALVSVFAFLLTEGKIKKFQNQVEQLQIKYQPWGLRLKVSGPWPAFNFV